MKRYKVWLRSVPGMYEQYDGYVEVAAEDDEDAIERALSKLKRTSFPGRNRGMWNVHRVERTLEGNRK
jgi:hypothetical protein